MKLLKKGVYYVLALLMFSATFSCEDDDELNIIRGLDFNIAELNAEGNEIGVIATTIPPDGRIVYTVDFGDPNSDADVFETSGPMVVYEYPEVTATYTIMVTASLPGRDDVSITEDYTVIFTEDVDPDPTPTGGVVGTWRLAPEAGAFGVGPGQGNVSWFSSSSEDVTTRDCLFDDEYVFNADGSFQNVLGSETWLEAWQGQDPEGCGTPVFPHDGTASATYDFDASAGTVTLNGTGAFLGLAKVVNGAELASPSEAPTSVTYTVELMDNDNTMILDIAIAGDGWWRFKLVKDAPPANPLVGSWRLAPEAGAFGVGPGQGNVSWFSSSSGDVTTRDCLFDDDYVFNEDGTFENILGSQTWLEAWQGMDPEGCGTPVFPHDGTASATYDYDASAGTVTLDGTGAFLGLAKVVNGAELTTPSEAPTSVTYTIELMDNNNTMIVDIAIAGEGWWRFKLVKQ